MIIPDFDALFAEYVDELGISDAEAEARLERLYEDWENSPCPALDGKKPAAFFHDMPPGQALAALLEYYARGMEPPHSLLDALQDAGEAVAPALLLLLQREDAPETLREFAQDLLSRLAYPPAMAYFREGLLIEPEHPLAPRWHHALKEHDDPASLSAWALAEYPAADAMARRHLLDFFADESSAAAFAYALEFFHEETEDVAYAANLLLRAAFFDEETALAALRDRLREPGLGYLAYHELCHAVEALGGEPPGEQEYDFSNDRDYLQLLDASE